MKIRTEYVYPPVPFRDCDWSAVDDDTYDGAEDSNCPIGRGATEAEAIRDLREQLGELDDDSDQPIPELEKASAPAPVHREAEEDGDHGEPGSQHPAEEAGAELIDSFDDTELNYEREPETNPQTGFDL